MTAPQENQAQPEQQPSNKEFNFRAIEAKLQQERNARLEAERRAQEAERMAQEAMARKQQEDDSDDDEPYVDPKKLAKQFASFERKMDEKIDKKAEEKARNMVEKERKESWIRTNPDFYDVIQQHADKFAEREPELAETILQMPEGFERQKLVYKNIKALGLHKPPEVKSTIQDKVDANRRSPYYQPSGVGSAPYAAAGDFSPSGQKNAYQKMQELKNKLRI